MSARTFLHEKHLWVFSSSCDIKKKSFSSYFLVRKSDSFIPPLLVWILYVKTVAHVFLCSGLSPCQTTSLCCLYAKIHKLQSHYYRWPLLHAAFPPQTPATASAQNPVTRTHSFIHKWAFGDFIFKNFSSQPMMPFQHACGALRWRSWVILLAQVCSSGMLPFICSHFPPFFKARIQKDKDRNNKKKKVFETTFEKVGGACGTQTGQLSGGWSEWRRKLKELQCEHYCFWALHTLLLMRKRCQSCGGLHEQPQTRARTQPNTGFRCTRSAFISCHLSTWNLGSIFNIQSWICLLGHACTEQTTVKYHTSLLVFCHRGETSPPPPPKRVNPSDLPHVVIELFPISCFFLVSLSDLKPEMLWKPLFFFCCFCCLFPQRSARTMAEYTLSTTTHGQHSGTILGPKGEAEAKMHTNKYECAWVWLLLWLLHRQFIVGTLSFRSESVCSDPDINLSICYIQATNP